MKIKNSGRKLAVASVCLLVSQTAIAWQQEYIVTEQNTPTERYIWDSERQPRYNDILEERIRSMQVSPGVALHLPDTASRDTTSTVRIGRKIPVVGRITTGPVAAWHYDGSTTSMYQSDSPVAGQFSDPLWHASISSVGWRVDSRIGGMRPWAQVSYKQQVGENAWKSQAGLYHPTAARQYDNWLDLSLGAEMPLLNLQVAAYTSLSQLENEANGQHYLYSLGITAYF